MIESREVLLRLNMTSNFAPSPLQSSHSSNWSILFAAWLAFNGNVNIGASETGWRSNNSIINEWLQIDFGAGATRTLASYSIYRASLTAANAPVNFTFSGSNDGTTWTELDSRSGITWEASVIVQRFNITSPVPFRFFRLSVPKATFNATIGIGQLEFTEIIPIEWFLDSDFNIQGYPHPIVLSKTSSGDHEFVKLELSMEPFTLTWSAEALGWKFINEILSGYPHIQYRSLVAPVLPASITNMELGHTMHFEGLESDLLVELIIKHLRATDAIVIEIRNSSDLLVWNTEFSSHDARLQTIMHTIPSSALVSLATDDYTVSTFIRREAEDGIPVYAALVVVAVPYVEVLSLSPPLIALPISTINNQVDIDYTVNGQGLESVTNSFTIAENSTSKTLFAAEFLVIESTTPTSGFWNANFNFQVTDPDFKLISLRFKFNQHNSNTEVRYNINGTNVMIVPRPANAPTEWIGWAAPEPIHLPLGANTIQVTNDFGDFVMFSTTNRPTTPGMDITSTTVWAMEMVYSVSTSSIESGKIQTASLTIGDDIDLGEHPLFMETEMLLGEFGSHKIESNTDFILKVVDALSLENTFIKPDALTTLSPPATIETRWRLNADFLMGETFSVVGKISIEGTDVFAAVDVDNKEFTIFFPDVLLPTGDYSFHYDLVAAHTEFGNFPVLGSVGNLLYVERILPPPQITLVEISHSGRYIGAEIGIGVTAHIYDIVSGDSIEIILRNNGCIIFSYVGMLGEGALSYSHTIPSEYFMNLPAGEYIVEVKINRDSLVMPITCTLIYQAIATPMIEVVSVVPDVFRLPVEPNTTIDTVWQVAMQEHSTISGRVGIFDTAHYGEASQTPSDLFTVQILNASPLPSGIHSFEYDFLISHDIYGEVEIMGIAKDKIFVAPAPIIAGGRNSINAFSTFPHVDDAPRGSHSIDAVINIHSNSYGNAFVSLNSPNVLIVTYITPEIGNIELDVDGRFSGSEVTVTVTASDMTDIEDGHIMRVELLRNNIVFHSLDTPLSEGEATFSHTIPAIAFVDAFSSLGYGKYFVRLQILHNGVAVENKELIYRIVSPPTMVLTNISHPTIQLPLFSPINLIANFAMVDNPGINSVTGTLTLGTITGTNASADPEGIISIALMNIAAIAHGVHSLSAIFEINSRYGIVSLALPFPNVIIVFPHIQSEGIDTKYEYDLILCMPNRTEIAFIEAYDVVYNPMFLQYNQLKFSIYREIVTDDNTKYINPVWEKILSDALVLMRVRINELVVYTEYFVIENPSISYKGLDELSFQANSWEILFLNNLDLSGWRDSVKRLYDPTNSIGDDGLPHGILNYILNMKWNNVWTLRHVDIPCWSERGY